MKTDVAQNLHEVLGNLPENVQLVAVSKYHPKEYIEAAYAEGQRVFGESHEQELKLKKAELPQDICWHFIGHLQTNKVKYIAPYIDMVEAVDSFKLLKEIKVSKAFIGVNGIDGHHVSTANEEEGNGNAIILNNAIEKYVVADNSKFDSYSFYSFYRVEDLNAIITDDSIPKKIKDKYGLYTKII